MSEFDKWWAVETAGNIWDERERRVARRAWEARAKFDAGLMRNGGRYQYTRRQAAQKIESVK